MLSSPGGFASSPLFLREREDKEDEAKEGGESFPAM